jgi:hypothetical protein
MLLFAADTQEIIVPALIAALVSILFGSVAAAIVSHLLTISRADKEYKLKKLEELFIAVQFWCNHLKKVYFNLGEGCSSQPNVERRTVERCSENRAS